MMEFICTVRPVDRSQISSSQIMFTHVMLYVTYNMTINKQQYKSNAALLLKALL